MSVFYPAPGSRDYELCATHGLLPDHFSGMRSSALPVSHTTSRKQAATLLRLARILNFMKSLLDRGSPIPEGSSTKVRVNNLDNRIEIGQQLIGKFLNDGRIRGVTPQGEIYDHLISGGISREFVAGYRGSTYGELSKDPGPSFDILRFDILRFCGSLFNFV